MITGLLKKKYHLINMQDAMKKVFLLTILLSLTFIGKAQNFSKSG